MQPLQIWKPYPQSTTWHQGYDNVFHLTMSCVQKHNNKFTIQEVTMAADTFILWTPRHLCFLCQKGLLEIIVAKPKWLQCLPSVWHQSSKYRPLAVPNSSYFLHFHSKYQDTEVVFIISDSSYILLFLFYSSLSAFSFTVMFTFPSYCSLFTLCICLSCKQSSSRSILWRKSLSTSCDSTGSEDGPILKHSKWLEKRHGSKKDVLFSCWYYIFCPVCKGNKFVCCSYNNNPATGKFSLP